jgi:hypothetical protein
MLENLQIERVIHDMNKRGVGISTLNTSMELNVVKHIIQLLKIVYTMAALNSRIFFAIFYFRH